VAEGALSLTDLRGDDRLSVIDPFVSAWSPDGEHLYLATRAAVSVWGSRSGALEATWALDAALVSVQALEVSPDGSRVAVVGTTRPPGASSDLPGVWLLRTGEHPQTTAFPGIGGPFHRSADGQRLYTDGHTWDLPTGAHRTTPRPPGITRWLPDGLRAVVLVPVPQTTPTGGRYTPVLWDAVTGRELHRFPAVAQLAEAVALSGDGTRVAVLGAGLEVFSTETFARVAHITDVPTMGLVNLSDDGRRAVVESLVCVHLLSTATRESHCPPPSLSLWDLDRAERLAHTASGAGQGWRFAPGGRYLTGPPTRLVDALLRVDDLTPVVFGNRVRSISPDGRLVLYERSLSLAVGSLDGSPQPDFARPPRVIARSPDGTLAATLDDAGALRIEGSDACVRLAMASGRYGRLPAGMEAFDTTRDQMVFSDDGQSLFVLSYVDSGRPRFRALDARSGHTRWSMQVSSGSTAAVSLSVGSLFVQGHGRPEVLRFDPTTGTSLPPGRAPRLSYTTAASGGETYEVRDRDGDRVSTLTLAAATRGGDVLATMGWFDHAMWFSRWDLQDPRRVVDVRVPQRIDRIALGPTERWWAVGLHDGRVHVYAAAVDRGFAMEAGHHGPITALAFTPTGHRLVTASEDGTLSLSDLSTGRALGRARFPSDRVTSVWVSPAGDVLRVETARGMRARFAIAGVGASEEAARSAR